jgi:membrane protease YdiL (CAAX protease family)
MTKKPAFWVLLALVSLASAAFSWRYFTSAFPLLSLDIGMDRQAALDSARALATERRLGPADFRDAASFSIDESVQTFVELEGGGKPAFNELVKDRLYTPYRWRVRHFKEGEKHEAMFTFAPDGTPNGFVERLREDAPGAALSPDQARTIAEATAARPWGVDLTVFKAVEQSQERRTSGRIDYTFAYERPDRPLGEGRYRLRLVVSGDKLTELAYFLKIPDAFSRRYEEMRSVNNAIGVGGSIAFLLLYGVGGMAVGLFFLVRQRWVLWRQPVFWGAVVALAQTAARVNEWPLAWMQYDTALSTRSFVAQQAALAVAELAAFVALFSLSFMAAESLTRRAFPSHPQFWRIWGREAGGSRAILGRTVAGFLLVPIFVAYEVALYFVATRWLGWWTPSEAQFNPDVLAAYAPWFSAIARSFQAGFWEEALFRAVPIAGAALIGDRFGNRRLWIVLAFIVQAVIFGAGHAPYPTQPAYARVVELVLPSIGFGLLYLLFGLLPAVILHFAFDVMWFAMPLFATTAAGIRLQQIIVVAAALAPLAVVLARRGTGQGGEVPLNAAWQPAPTVVTEPPPPAVASDAGLRPSLVKWLTVAGPLAAAVWMMAIGRLPVQRHTLQASRAEATQVARTALSSARLGPEWRFLPVAGELFGPPHRFVWTTAGQATYASLLGTYLNAPGWSVFVRTFEGDVAERAENWTVRLDADGAVQGISHELPESRAGASLDEATAGELAKREVVTRFGIDPSVLKDVAATPSQLPKRIDWTVTFSDTSHPLPTGELRLQVRLAGDEVAQARRFVFIPEDWERNERNAQTIASIVTGGGLLLAGVAMVAGLITAIISWSRRQFSVRVFLVVFASFLVFSAARLANSFPTLMAQLSTAQPLQLQLAVLLGSTAVGVIVQSVAMALVAGAAPYWCFAGRVSPRVAATLGFSLGAVAAGAVAISMLSARAPMWPSYAGASSFVPVVAAATTPVIALLTRITFLLLIVGFANRLSAHWTRRRVLVGALVVCIGGVLGNAAPPLNLGLWIASAGLIGLLLLLAYVFVLRHDVSVIPLAAAVMTTAATLPEGLAQAYPSALPGALVAVALAWIVAYLWFRALAGSPGATALGEIVTA